jgi:hypothetical protein
VCDWQRFRRQEISVYKLFFLKYFRMCFCPLKQNFNYNQNIKCKLLESTNNSSRTKVIILVTNSDHFSITLWR